MEDTRPPAEVASSATVEVAATPPPRFMREDEVAQNPPVALASYPRSGNSLLRVLLEKVTGHITGSDTRPDRKLSRELLDYGLLGEGVVDLSQVWIVKTHFPERFGYKRYKVKKIILLVRNPFDTLDSYFNMVLTSSHTKSLDESEYERLQREWDQLVRREIQVWTKFYEYYLFVARSSGVPLKVVRYEDLMTRRWHTMRGLICFLYDLKSLKGTVYDERIQALATHELTQSHQAYKPRKGKVDHSLAHFSEEQKSFILKLTRDVLCYFGYSKYLDLLRAPSPSPSPSPAAVGGSEPTVAPDLTQKNESGGKSESESEDPERKEKRRTEKEEIVAYILKNYQDSRIYLTPGLLHVNFGLPLREVSPTDPFGRGMSWKKEVLALKPVALEQPTNNEQ